MNEALDPSTVIALTATASAARRRGRARRKPVTRRSYTCQCGKPIYFRNSRCLACLRPLGYDPALGDMLALEQMHRPDEWRAIGPHAARAAGLYHRCSNLGEAAGCNWLIPINPAEAAASPQRLCRACRLNRTVPDLSNATNAALWARVELAKRRLVSSLIALKLPVASRVGEDPERGLAFDLLHPNPGAPVTTGHHDGVITLNLEEADDVKRESARVRMNESYRTLLGHLRHEVGHYYWQRLVDGSGWHEPFRHLFGDERVHYTEALERHYANGPPADWQARHVSAYASAHPWEDWAETWAHYLHIVDTLDTAASFGLDRQRADLQLQPFTSWQLWRPAAPHAEASRADPRDAEVFLPLINAWIELTAVMNELARSMGQPDLYPFVLSTPAITKLHFVHLVIHAQRARPQAARRRATAMPHPPLPAASR